LKDGIDTLVTMNLKLQAKDSDSESIEITLPVPMSLRLKNDIDRLKKICGKEVNKKAREFFENLIKENRDKLEKAG
jgi:hypothetical protein